MSYLIKLYHDKSINHHSQLIVEQMNDINSYSPNAFKSKWNN